MFLEKLSMEYNIKNVVYFKVTFSPHIWIKSGQKKKINDCLSGQIMAHLL